MSDTSDTNHPNPTDPTDGPDPSPEWDALVVGRSFAGLSAALNLGRTRRPVLVVGSGGPRNEAVAHAHGLLSRDHQSPSTIVAEGEAQLARYPNVELVDARVTAVEAVPGGFRATIGTRTTLVGNVIVATGANDDPLPIPGLAERWGRGVFTCPYCDGFEHQDRHLAVVGDPAFAPHLGRILTEWSDAVTVFSADLDDATEAQLTAQGVRLDRRPVRRLIGGTPAAPTVEAIEVAGDAGAAATVEVGAVFHARLPVPNSGLARELGCDLGADGSVVVDGFQRTTVPGVWAVGDVAGMPHQISFSLAQGAMAGTDCHRRLMGMWP